MTIRIRIAAVIAAMLALLIGATGQSSAFNQNLDVAAVTASSSQAGNEPQKAADDVYDTSLNQWAAAAAPSSLTPQWIKFDLGAVKFVGALDLYPEPGYGPKNFVIETSVDDSDYTVQRTVSLTADKHGFYDWTPQKARYVRISATAGFNDAFKLREAIWFAEIYPHRVMEIGALNLYDFSRLTDAGFDALKAANVQITGVIALAENSSKVESLLPSGGDPDMDANYTWTSLDAIVDRFTSHGLDVLMGQSKLSPTKWPALYQPLVDEDGNTWSIGPNPFIDQALDYDKNFTKKIAAHFDLNPNVRLQSINGPGFYGGMEVFTGAFGAGTTPKMSVYDSNAKAKFRAWLQTKYASLAALNTAWGSSYAAWNDVQPPYPQRSMSGDLDTRQNWSDLVFWLRDFISDYAQQNAAAVRSVTDKPIVVEVDGAYLGASTESGSAMGWIARAMQNYKPIVFAASSAEEVYGAAQVAATARLYGYDTAMDNASYQTEKMSEDSIFALQAKGIGTYSHSNIGISFEGTGYDPVTDLWDPSGTYVGTKELTQYADRTARLLAVAPQPVQADVFIYNSVYSGNYRKGLNNFDYMSVYDADHGIGWMVKPFASWAHYLNTPDVLDDFTIEDGALDGYKLMVAPNTSLTLTSDDAETKIKNWVAAGNAIVSFGKDAFNYKVNLADRSVTGGTAVTDWMMGISGGTAATTTSQRYAIVASGKPSWLTSLRSGEGANFTVSDSGQAQAFTALAAGATPVLVDADGNVLMCEYTYGSGHVLFSTIPVSDSEMFRDSFMGRILRDFADYAGIEREVQYDGDRFHAAYMGTNKLNDEKVIAVANVSDMSHGQTFVLGSDSSLAGLSVIADIPAPWNTVTGATLRELSLKLPQKQMAYTASASQPVTLSAEPYGTLPAHSATAGMFRYPYTPVRAIDGSRNDDAGWRGGKPTAEAPQTLTVDFGGVFPVAGMQLFPYTDGVDSPLFTFENGRYTGNWNSTGTAFGAAPTIDSHGGIVSGWSGSFWADSFHGGEIATGTLRSRNFVIDKELFSFKAVGWDGQFGEKNENYYFLRRASDSAILFSAKPPLSDSFATISWGVGQLIGTEAYFEIVDDNDDPGHAWLGADDLTLSDYKENKETADLSFESGTFAGWSTTGTAFGAAPSNSDNAGVVKGWRGTYWGNSRTAGETATGTLRSANFVIEDNLLSFRAVGYDGEFGTHNQNYIYLKRASDGAILLSTKPPQSDMFTDITWDVSTYKGVTAYLEVVDNDSDGGFAWLGIDHVVLGRNDNFERGNFTGWTVSGTAFGTNPITTRLHEGVYGNEGRYWADSSIGGEAATGSLRSADFTIQKPVLAFRGAGFDGQFGTHNKNWFYLKRASDGAVLLSSKPPQGSFRTYYWDVSAYIGTSVYIEAVDGNSDASYAWLAIDDVYQLNNFDFEDGTYGGWTKTGTAFGGGPLVTGHADMGGWRGIYHADSFAGGETAVGTLRSADFILEEGFFTFLKAGYDGQFGTANKNFYYLKRASDGAVLFSTKPPQSDHFVAHTWDVSAYVGTKVYFEVVDDIAANGFAWLAVDDINWRGLGPKSFTVQTSTDAVNWSTVYTVTSQGNQAAQYTWSPVNARYVRVNVTSGYNGSAFIKELTFSRPITAWTIASATASSLLTGFEASKTIDGIFDNDLNYWSPNGSFPHTLTLDLGSAKDVTGVELFSRNNTLAQKLGPQSFDILVSLNGTDWINVYSALSDSEALARYTFPTVSARYVRLAITSGWNGSSQIKEVRLYP